MTNSTHTTEYSTLSLERDIKSRLQSLKPYESMSWSEFVEELADVYEEQQN